VLKVETKELLKKDLKTDSMDGLIIKNGRLINNRPEWTQKSGIEVAAEMRKEVKRAKLASTIADGISMADERKEMRDFFKGML
jgi:hypothetical protein